MKKVLSINFILIILSWALFIDHHTLAAFFLLFLTDIYLYLKTRDINIFRTIIIYLLSFSSLYLFFKMSNLISFYPLFDTFIFILAINLSLSIEALLKTKIESIYQFYLIAMSLFVAFMALTIVIPDYLYSLFSKLNIYSLIVLIFLPYCIEMTIILLYKEEKRKNMTVVLKEKEESI